MKLYWLSPNYSDAMKAPIEWTSKGQGCVNLFQIMASSPEEARLLASAAHGDEGAAVWLDESKVSCTQAGNPIEAQIIVRVIREG